MTDKKYLNLGCGHNILPAPRPAHHTMVDEALYSYPHWHNVDVAGAEGVDEKRDLFEYPWPWEDNAYGGALVAQFAENIPHEIPLTISAQRLLERSITHSVPGIGVLDFYGQAFHSYQSVDRVKRLTDLADGFYAFFSELHRVLEPGAIVHVFSTYGKSDGALADPEHKRFITEHTFLHGFDATQDKHFMVRRTGCNYQIVGMKFDVTPMFAHLVEDRDALNHALMTQFNVAYNIYVQLKVVK